MINLNNKPEITYLSRGSLAEKGKFRFTLNNRCALHLYYSPCKLSIGDKFWDITPGMISFTPSGVESVYETQNEISYLCVHFLPLDMEPFTGSIPLCSETENDYFYINNLFSEALTLWKLYPIRSEIKIWEILLILDSRNRQQENSVMSEIVQKTIGIIEADLGKSVKLDKISAQVGVSPVHLNRLFKKQVGKSVILYIRDRKMEQAQYFLRNTNQSIKSISYDLGISDLQAFNKLCKKYFGKSPSEIRKVV